MISLPHITLPPFRRQAIDPATRSGTEGIGTARTFTGRVSKALKGGSGLIARASRGAEVGLATALRSTDRSVIAQKEIAIATSDAALAAGTRRIAGVGLLR